MVVCIQVYTMAKTNPIPVRLSDNVRNMISDYAAFFDVSMSQALREIIKEGLMRKTHLGLLKKWQEKVRHRNPMLSMGGKCDKCRLGEDLKIRHIDGNIRNFDTENLAVLCEDCVRKLNRSLQKYNPKEKFAAWFFYET